MAKPRRGATTRSVGVRPALVVGLGSSAGGLAALQAFFTASVATGEVAYVVVAHLAPDHEGLLPALIQRTTALAVIEVPAAGARLAADTVYVIPPARELVVEGERLRVRAAPRARSAPYRIDTFLRSLARARGATAIGVILSGMGGDGAAGLRAIVDAGGAALVQDPASAGFDAMPRAAIAAVPEARVAGAEELAGHVADLVRDHGGAAGSHRAALTRVLASLHRHTGHDLGDYKPSSIERRLERRLAVHRLASLDAYADYLDSNAEEAELLLRELLIGVTWFFRDEEALSVLRDSALPAVLAAKRGPRSLRAWVAGCSSGEEAYSLAIVLREAITRAGAADVALQIYATDLDPATIAWRTASAMLGAASSARPTAVTPPGRTGSAPTGTRRAAPASSRANTLALPSIAAKWVTSPTGMLSDAPSTSSPPGPSA
jgi:two-component system, chemotaxis family, CheB/CheR fusion protein